MLAHGRFPGAQRRHLAAVLAGPVPGRGQIVVSDPCLETGADLSCRLLFTEGAPLPSLVRRASLCNRAEEHDGAAVVLWAPPSGRGTSPYVAEDVQAGADAFARLEDTAVTTAMLQDLPVAATPVVHQHVRRRDVEQLFDTRLDLSGSPVDVSCWTTGFQDTTALVAWRVWPDGRPDRTERYPVPGPRSPTNCARCR